MIARVWRGQTKNEHAELYENIIVERDLPNYKKTEGFVKFSFLKHSNDELTFFELLTYWADIGAVAKFTGPNFEIAKAYPDDEQYLLDFPGSVEHFEVFAE